MSQRSNRPLVTVVTAVYNGERYLREALESLFAQDYEPFESIVVDDGSTDRSAEIAQSFLVRYLRQENRGAASARNLAFEHARGELVTFLDDDDVLPPWKIRVQAEHLVEHPEVGCVLGRQELVFEEGVEPPPWFERDRIYGDVEGLPLLAAMIRKSVLDELGGFDPSYSFAEDRDLFVRMRERGVEIAVLPDLVLYRRFHGENQNLSPPPKPPVFRSLKEKLDRGRTTTAASDGEIS
jgi:glycosyltransferase involved in cell wall biosynthesis